MYVDIVVIPFFEISYIKAKDSSVKLRLLSLEISTFIRK